MWEVRQRNVAVEREKKVPIVYKGHTVGLPLQLDLLAVVLSLWNVWPQSSTTQFLSPNR
jgi:hypothetical protein